MKFELDDSVVYVSVDDDYEWVVECVYADYLKKGMSKTEAYEATMKDCF